MNNLFIKQFCVGFMVSEIPRVSVFGYFPLINLLIFIFLSYLTRSSLLGRKLFVLFSLY